MLYNKDLNRPRTNIDCLSCEWFDKIEKRCNGIGKACFEYDEKTMTILDPVTKLPLNLKGE